MRDDTALLENFLVAESKDDFKGETVWMDSKGPLGFNAISEAQNGT